MYVALARFWKTRRDTALEVGDNLRRGVAVESWMGWVPPKSVIGHCHTRDRWGLTPSACVGVIYGGIDIAQVNLAHEAIDLQRRT